MSTDYQGIYTARYYQVRAYEADNLSEHFALLARQVRMHIWPEISLDVGCARGYFVQALRARGVKAFGIDISSYALENCAPGLRSCLVQGNASEYLPFDNGTFDLVTCMECLEHMPQPQVTIAEMARVLKQDGFVLASAPKITVWHRLFNAVFGQAEVHPSELTLREWIRVFDSCGFQYIGNWARDWYIDDELHKLTVGRTAKMIPCTAVGRLLNRLGAPGRWLRVWLNVLVWQWEYMLFRLR